MRQKFALPLLWRFGLMLSACLFIYLAQFNDVKFKSAQSSLSRSKTSCIWITLCSSLVRRFVCPRQQIEICMESLKSNSSPHSQTILSIFFVFSVKVHDASKLSSYSQNVRISAHLPAQKPYCVRHSHVQCDQWLVGGDHVNGSYAIKSQRPCASRLAWVSVIVVFLVAIHLSWIMHSFGATNGRAQRTHYFFVM